MRNMRNWDIKVHPQPRLTTEKEKQEERKRKRERDTHRERERREYRLFDLPALLVSHLNNLAYLAFRKRTMTFIQDIKRKNKN